MDFLFRKISRMYHQNQTLSVIYICNILLSFHYALILYINSSFLEQFFSDAQVSTLYIIGSVLNLLVLINASKILNFLGNFRLLIFSIFLEILSIIGMIFSTDLLHISFYFILHHIVISLIVFSLDIFLEGSSNDESKTGEIRGAYMTFANITFVFAPLLLSIIIQNKEFERVYATSILFLIPLLFYVFKYFIKIPHSPINHFKIKETIAVYLKNKNLYDILIANFLLQLFYAFMIIYTPIYLSKYIGFQWSEIGKMFTIMLLPFALFELPIGNLADKKYGEKEILTMGFIINGLATLFISFITVKSFAIWTIVLFLTRTGASFIEITTESYFFKQVKADQTDIISFFRINRPVSFIIAPILATIALEFISYRYIFMILGASIIIFGAHYSLALKDTK